MQSTPVSGSDARQRLHWAMDGALKQYEIAMGEAFETAPIFKVSDDPDFWALVEPVDEKYRIQISTGVVSALDRLWEQASRDLELLSSDGTPHAHDKKNLSHVSMVWLLLHELMHIQLGHYDFTGDGYLPETEAARKFALLSHSDSRPAPIESLPPEDQLYASPCLELQADTDAIDILLEAYSNEHWGELRMRAACVFAVMALIEREDRRHEKPSKTHPIIATRFFLMLGYLFQMWSYPVSELEPTDIGSKLRSQEKIAEKVFENFKNQVIAPAVNDAVILAATTKAESFLRDVSGDGPLILDVLTVQYAENLMADDLLSEGAKEWLQLTLTNEKIMTMMGLRE